MKTKITLLIAMLAIIGFGKMLNAQTNFQWAASMGGTINDYGQAIATDASGNVYTTGYFTGTADFDPGPGSFTLNCVDNGDIFVSKLDAAGNFIWAKKLGGTNANGDTGESIILDAAGNIYITGRFSGTADFDPGVGVFNLTTAYGFGIFICKLDNSGNFIWAKAIENGLSVYNIAKSITLDASNNIYITGTFSEAADFDPGAGIFTLTSAGYQDIFVCKLDNSGNFVWAKQLGGTGVDRAFGIALDAAGNVFTTGYAGGGDFDPGPGTFNLAIGLFVSKLDSAGNFVWAKRFSGTQANFSYAIATDASGNVYTTGSFSGTADFDPNAGTFDLVGGSGSQFISKLDNAGNFVWAKAVTEAKGLSIKTDASANVYTSGYFALTSDFDPNAGIHNLTSLGMSDLFISKLDSAGNFIDAISIGGPYNDEGACLALNGVCDIYLTGYYNGTVDFDPGLGTTNLSSLNSNDIFVLYLSCLATAINEDISIRNPYVSIYPNPSNGIFQISPNELQLSKLEIYNLLGEKVYASTINTESNLTIDLSNQSPGIYFVRIYEGDKMLLARIDISN